MCVSLYFQCFKLNFEKSLLLGSLKHNKSRGFSNYLCFCCWKRRKQVAKNDNWNFWFGVFWVQKWPFRDAHLFSKMLSWNPHFYSVLGVRAFWARLSKREILDTHLNKLSDSIFCILLFFSPFFVVFCCFLFFLSFPFFDFIWKACFPLKWAFFVYYWVSPFVSP